MGIFGGKDKDPKKDVLPDTTRIIVAHIVKDDKPKEPEFNIDEECQFEPDCHFETVHEYDMHLHLQKHKKGQQIIEQQARTHQRRVDAGQMTSEQKWACEMADRYFHLTVELQDFERTDKFIKEVFDKLDIGQKLAFTKYIGGRMITVGQHLDALIMQQQQQVFRLF